VRENQTILIGLTSPYLRGMSIKDIKCRAAIERRVIKPDRG